MQVIALISGGKDSFFSILHCIKNGHRIVALANLQPPSSDTSSDAQVTTCLPQEDLDDPIPLSTSIENDELDSFVYQTIGHNLLPYYATALNIPLYRTTIVGKSVNQNLSYQLAENDETEDLYRLLADVQKQHPGANGVSSGAILSSYQRTRVENVCSRLGLISLSYLWQRPQHLLLDEMASVGLDARIVKVAAIGLNADDFLWQNVTSAKVRTKLRNLKRRYGVHIAGEGGEYETMVVQGPGWRTRLVVDNEKGDALKVILGDSDVGHLKILKAGWEKIGDGKGEEQEKWVRELRKPQLLNSYFWKILKAVEGTETKFWAADSKSSLVQDSKAIHVHEFIPTTSHKSGTYFVVNNLSAPNSNQEMADIMTLLADRLAKLYTETSEGAQLGDRSTMFANITHVTLLLRSMSDFSTVNAIYNEWFPHPNPPSRVCVAIGDVMPVGCNILMHTQACFPSERRGLHIQGRSYWAPANIGPYSQAISAQGLVYISGQIPLVPSTMELPVQANLPLSYEGNLLELQTVLAMQHMWRVARAMKTSAYASVMGFTTTRAGALIMNQAWREHISTQHQQLDDDNSDEEDDEILNPKLWEVGQDEDVVDETPYEDTDISQGYSTISKVTPEPSGTLPLLVVQVSDLPRGAPVEWVALGIDEEYKPTAHLHDDNDDDGRYEPQNWTINDTFINGDVPRYIRTWYHRRAAYGSVLTTSINKSPPEAASDVLQLLGSQQGEKMVPCIATIYVSTEAGENTVSEVSARLEELLNVNRFKDLLQVIPVHRIWLDEEEVKLGVVVRFMAV